MSLFQNKRVRWGIFGLLCLAVWWLPWQIFLMIWLGALLIWPRFYWLILPALLFDLSYSSALAGPLKFTLPITVATVILLILVDRTQEYIRV